MLILILVVILMLSAVELVTGIAMVIWALFGIIADWFKR